MWIEDCITIEVGNSMPANELRLILPFNYSPGHPRSLSLPGAGSGSRLPHGRRRPRSVSYWPGPGICFAVAVAMSTSERVHAADTASAAVRAEEAADAVCAVEEETILARCDASTFLRARARNI